MVPPLQFRQKAKVYKHNLFWLIMIYEMLSLWWAYLFVQLLYTCVQLHECSGILVIVFSCIRWLCYHLDVYIYWYSLAIARLLWRDNITQEGLANTKGTCDSSACMKAHCLLGCSRLINIQIPKSPSALHNELVTWRHLANAIELSQPKITKTSIKTLFWHSRSSKVIALGANRKPVYDFLLVINSNLGSISHRFSDTGTYWLKIIEFFYPLSFCAMEFLLWKSFTLPETRVFWAADGEDLVILAWKSLHCLWLIHPCDGRMDGQNCDG